MSPKAEQIFAVCHFDSSARAQQAIQELNQIGIPSSGVQTISGDSVSGKPDAQIEQQFLSAGVHQDDAAYLQRELRQKGGVLAIVKTDPSNEAKVDEIFRRYGAHETDEYRANNSPRGTNDTLQVVEEELVVGKRAVSRGGMRIYSRVIETPVEQNISLTEETVRVERHKVDRPVNAADLDALGREQVIEMRATGEEAVVGKTARVVEEVTLGKEASARTETVRDTVRKTDVQVENIDPEVNRQFQEDYRTRYGKTGEQFETYAPAYQYGYTAAKNPAYAGKSYSDVESHLRSDYESSHTGGTGAWEKIKDAVQTGWNKVTGK